MIGLDMSQLPSDIAALLTVRGTGLLPLQWSDHPNRSAKNALDEIDDKRLFGCETLADETTAAAVRALLYLWNGWPSEGSMHAQISPEKERPYVAGLCERHAGNPNAAKDCFRQLNGHAIHQHLSTYTVETIGSTEDKVVQRFKGLLELDENWEPFLFVDVCEQAKAGKCSDIGEEIVRRIQCREFELLLAHCCQEATGKQLVEKTKETAVPKRPKRKTPTRRSTQPSGQMSSTRQSPSSSKSSAPKKEAVKGSDTVQIRCPKCEQITSAPESARGKHQKCKHCGVMMMVPRGKEATAPGKGFRGGTASGRSDQLGLLCPKCGQKLTVPESARGQKTRCHKCAAVFMVPRRQPARST